MGCLQSKTRSLLTPIMTTVAVPNLPEKITKFKNPVRAQSESRSAESSGKITIFKNPVHAQSESHLASMALELREHIYHFLLSPHESDPSLFVTDYTGRRDPSTVAFSVDEYLETPSQCNYYPLKQPLIPSSALLLCCQLIHQELGSIIERMLKKKTLRYELDCEIVNEQFMYPTWTLVPAYSLHIPHVDVTVRMSGECTRKNSAWRWGNGGPGYMVWSFFSLLLRFLERGPHFLSPKPSSSAPGLTIGTLTLNFITPTLPSDAAFIPPESYSDWDSTELYIHPDTVIEKIRYSMNLMLDGTHGNFYSHYQRKVVEGVGIINLCCDGEDRVVWDSQLKILRRELLRTSLH